MDRISLVDPIAINKRLDAIEYLNDNFITKDELKEHLGYVYDMERLSAVWLMETPMQEIILRLVKTLETCTNDI